MSKFRWPFAESIQKVGPFLAKRQYRKANKQKTRFTETVAIKNGKLSAQVIDKEHFSSFIHIAIFYYNLSTSKMLNQHVKFKK